jgi:hypothetical protein
MKITMGKTQKSSTNSGGKVTPVASAKNTGALMGFTNTINFADNVDNFEIISDGGILDDEAAVAPRQSAVLDKSFIMGETNITQMIKSLGNRTESLKSKMCMAKELLRADVELNEEGDERGAKDLPKIVNDADEEVPKSLRELRMMNATTNRDPAKMNLVTSDNIFIDPYHLVLKTKAPTDAARKIESVFQGSTNNRDTKKPKAKSGVNADHAKKEEQVKNNSKRINRLRLERKLQQITETFVTRNVNDKMFQLPDYVDEEPKWSVAVKWSSKDPRSALPENAEGEFDPDLLLRYALEMIELPSGRKLFSWLIKQTVVQSYFVLLFWMIKVKFFETEQVDEKEVFLLHKLSREYRKLVEMLAQRSHAEHEKDFVFKYVPFILANGVFYSFFYLFPGSRHSTNTKAFKKTVYMQVVQIMHGFQVCPISVKVSWAKLFPEDVHDAEALDDGEEGKEIFPVPFAIKTPKLEPPTSSLRLDKRRKDGQESPTLRRKEGQLALSRPSTSGDSPLGREVTWDDTHSDGGASSPGIMSRSRSALMASRSKSGIMAMDSTSLADSSTAPSLVKRFASSGAAKGSALRFGLKKPSGFPKLSRNLSQRDSRGDIARGLSRSNSLVSGRENSLSLDDDEDYDLEEDPFSEENITQTLAALKSQPQMQRRASVAKLAMQRTVSVAKITPPPMVSTTNVATAENKGLLGLTGNGSDQSNANLVSPVKEDPLSIRRASASSAASDKISIPAKGNIDNNDIADVDHLFSTKHLSENPRYLRPLSKTHLKPPPAKPNNVATVKRQGVVDRISAQQVSPQMALLLSELKDSGPIDSNSNFSQTVRRTIPVNWCPAGGTDTHHRTTIATDLHHEISEKLSKSRDEFKQIGSLAHHRKIKINENLNKELDKVWCSVF